MARRHVVRHGGMLAVAAAAPMNRDALATQEHLHRASGEAGIDLGAGIAVGDAVEVVLDLDVVVDPNAANAPLRQHIWFRRQRLQRRAFDRLKQLAAGLPDAAYDPLV